MTQQDQGLADEPHAHSAAEPGVAPAPEYAAPAVATPTKRRRARTWIVRSLVTVLILGLAGLSTYLVIVSQQWSDRVDELTAISTDLGKQVGESKAQAATANAARDDAVAQLDELKARTTDLANEEAHANDNQSVLLNYLDAMKSCSDQRQQLIDGLQQYGNSGMWSDDSGKTYTTKQFEQEITNYCNSVTSEIDALKAELGT